MNEIAGKQRRLSGGVRILVQRRIERLRRDVESNGRRTCISNGIDTCKARER